MRCQEYNLPLCSVCKEKIWHAYDCILDQFDLFYPPSFYSDYMTRVPEDADRKDWFIRWLNWYWLGAYREHLCFLVRLKYKELEKLLVLL